jgi:hypothetical protein
MAIWVGSLKDACAFVPSTPPAEPEPANVVTVGVSPGIPVLLLLLLLGLLLLQEAKNKTAGRINVKGIFIFLLIGFAFKKNCNLQNKDLYRIIYIK